MIRQSVRSIYLHAGKRVQGLKRDPGQVFTTASGHLHEPSHENLHSIKAFLSDKYAILDTLALQVLTHKSFGNGIKPHNEKLSALGAKLLNLYTVKRVTGVPTNNENAVGGKNLDVLGSPIARELGGRLATGLFARSTKLNQVMFWKSYNHGLSFEASGELKVSALMVYALIGAVTFTHGKTVAEQFIREKLVESNPSIEEIATKVVEQAEQAGQADTA